MPIAVTVAALLAVSLYGYATPPIRPEVPPRVLFDNSGGRVFLDHATHAQGYGYECEDCHHDGAQGDSYLPCGECHPKNFDVMFVKAHQKAFPDKEYCSRCHDEEPADGLPKDELPDVDMMPTRSDAFHGQCMGCHEAEGVGPQGEDSCITCHAK